GPPPILSSDLVTALPPRHQRTGDLEPVRSTDSTGEPVLHVVTQPLVADQLRRLWPPRHQLRFPLRDRGPIGQPAVSGGGVAAQLAGDRRGRATESPSDLAHSGALGAQQRNLLPLGE